MSHLFYCFLVQFDRVVLQKKKMIILSRGPLGVGTYVPMSWPYMSLYVQAMY